MLLLIRHCQATGQAPDAPLTDVGRQQAELLADVLAHAGIERIVSSPWVRATASVEPLARRLDLSIEHDERLTERVLSTTDLPDWKKWLRASFDDLDLIVHGGESSREAMARATAVVDEILSHEATVTAIATHGNLLALILKYFDDNVGFEEWRRLANPDVFRIDVGNNTRTIRRVWTEYIT